MSSDLGGIKQKFFVKRLSIKLFIVHKYVGLSRILMIKQIFWNLLHKGINCSLIMFHFIFEIW